MFQTGLLWKFLAMLHTPEQERDGLCTCSISPTSFYTHVYYLWKLTAEFRIPLHFLDFVRG